MLPQSPLEIKDFSGGITDEYVGSPQTDQKVNKNFLIKEDLSPVVRPGSLKEGGDDTFCKIPGPVDGILPPLVSDDIPYKLSNNTSAGRMYYNDTTTHVELVGPTGNPLFTAAHESADDSRFIPSKWNAHHFITSASFTQKVQKVYVDSLGALQLRTAGMPLPASDPTFTPGTTAHRYIYGIGYKYTYNSNGREFIDRGPLRRFEVTTTNPISGGNPVAFTNLPVISNGASDNYDESSPDLVLEIYRTTDNGRILYFVAEVTNGTTSYNDTMTDAALTLQPVHYSTGGVPDYDPPPKCKFMHVTERGIGLYCYVEDGSDTYKNMFKQSIPNAPDKVPGAFNAELDEEFTGVSSYKGVPIFFSTDHVYRGEGQFSQTGQGGMIPRKIADSVGCISHTSIVQTPDGVFFASQAGFYWTDGYSVMKISDKFNQTYRKYYSGYPVDIYGTFDEINRLCMWTFVEDTNSDGIFVFHLRFGIKPRATFTIWGGKTDPVASGSGIYPSTLPSTINQNFRAKCLASFNNIIYRGDDRGYAFFFSDTSKTDPRVDTGVDCSNWGTTAIHYDLQTVALDFGTSFVRKWCTKVITTLKNVGNVSLSILTDRDIEDRPKACREIKKQSSVTWGESGILWGDESLWSSESALFVDKRNLPVPGLRASYRQLYFRPSFTVIQKSDNLGTGTIDAALKTLTLTTVGNTFDSNILDYYISVPDSGGEYNSNFLITAVSGNELTFSDPSNFFTQNITTKWEIHGYAKGEIIDLQSVVLPFALIGSTQSPYRPGMENGNA